MTKPPLTGIKVLDFTHLLPGELCATVLSDMGAHVVRIEHPVPGLAQKLPPVIKGESLFYWSLQRDKSRIKVDLKTPEGLEQVKNMVPDCDVVIENFRAGVMDRLGLGYEVLSKLNPSLIYLSISGYGHNSDKSDRPVHDLNLVAETGILSLNRRENERPVLPAIPVSDYMAALLAALSILGALYDRKETGKGRSLDISMEDSALASLNVLGSCILYTGKSPNEGGFPYPKEFPNYNVYECKDGRFLAVACLESQFWSTFCNIIERPDLVPIIDNIDEHPQLTETIAALIREKTLDQWNIAFAGSNCCVSPVKSPKEAFDTYPLEERQMISNLSHPLLGNIPQILFPVDVSLRKVQAKLSESSQTIEANR